MIDDEVREARDILGLGSAIPDATIRAIIITHDHEPSEYLPALDSMRADDESPPAQNVDCAFQRHFLELKLGQYKGCDETFRTYPQKLKFALPTRTQFANITALRRILFAVDPAINYEVTIRGTTDFYNHLISHSDSSLEVTKTEKSQAIFLIGPSSKARRPPVAPRSLAVDEVSNFYEKRLKEAEKVTQHEAHTTSSDCIWDKCEGFFRCEDNPLELASQHNSHVVPEKPTLSEIRQFVEGRFGSPSSWQAWRKVPKSERPPSVDVDQLQHFYWPDTEDLARGRERGYWNRVHVFLLHVRGETRTPVEEIWNRLIEFADIAAGQGHPYINSILDYIVSWLYLFPEEFEDPAAQLREIKERLLGRKEGQKAQVFDVLAIVGPRYRSDRLAFVPEARPPRGVLQLLKDNAELTVKLFTQVEVRILRALTCSDLVAFLAGESTNKMLQYLHRFDKTVAFIAIAIQTAQKDRLSLFQFWLTVLSCAIRDQNWQLAHEVYITVRLKLNAPDALWAKMPDDLMSAVDVARRLLDEEGDYQPILQYLCQVRDVRRVVPVLLPFLIRIRTLRNVPFVVSGKVDLVAAERCYKFCQSILRPWGAAYLAVELDELEQRHLPGVFALSEALPIVRLQGPPKAPASEQARWRGTVSEMPPSVSFRNRTPHKH
jgi:hypothetical protein